MSAEIASAIIAAVALVVAGRSYYIATVQARSSAQAARAAEVAAQAAAVSARLPALIDLQREFRAPKMTNARHYIKHKLLIEYPATEAGLESINDQDMLLTVIEVIHYFDNLGHFLRKELLFPHDISHFMGKAGEDCWKVLIMYMMHERNKQGQSPYYGENFDYLVKHCNAESQASSRNAA